MTSTCTILCSVRFFLFYGWGRISSAMIQRGRQRADYRGVLTFHQNSALFNFNCLIVHTVLVLKCHVTVLVALE